MEEIYISYETSVGFQRTTRRHILQDSTVFFMNVSTIWLRIPHYLHFPYGQVPVWQHHVRVYVYPFMSINMKIRNGLPLNLYLLANMYRYISLNYFRGIEFLLTN
jgi:hypothetical protein